MGLAWVLGVLAVTAVAAGPAEDSERPRLPATIDLEWNAPDDCASGEEVLTRMRELLSGPAVGQGEARVVADIEVGNGIVRMTLTAVFEGRTDRREVESSNCQSLVEATAVLLAVSLDPGLGPEPVQAEVPEVAPQRERDLPTRPTVAVEPKQAPRPGPTPADDSQAPDARPARLHGFVGGEAGIEWGALDALALASRISVGVRGTRWNAQAHGTYLIPRRLRGGLYQLGTAGARGCWTPGSKPWFAQLCVGGEMGGFRVDTRGIEPPTSDLGLYAGPSIAFGIVRRGPSVEWLFGGEVVARAWGSRTRLPGPIVLIEQQPVSVRMATGVRFSFFPTR